ncbi:MAG TPA: FecR domain-containing protein [Opitutaceae bacterium]|nr:FecR domain-containing protein [Opitutaceae bacterium]
MKPVPPPSSLPDAAVEAMAAAWLAERDAGLSPAQAAEFAAWRQADPRHAAAVARLERTWQALQALRTYRPDARRHPDRDALVRPRRAPVVRLRGWLAAGLAAAAGLAVAAFWWTPRTEAPPRPVYATTTDGYLRLTLVDGSVLELNADSQARVEFEPAVRRVRLVRGEAHFTVVKDAGRPFVVMVGAVSVRAVGTAFNVRLGPGDVEVLVTEGRVRVEHPAHATVAPPEVGAGERVVIPVAREPRRDPALVVALPPETISESLAWQGPRLRFSDTPLREVVAQFNRRNQLQLELADPALGELTVDGSFRVEHVEAFVRLLERNGGIRSERRGSHRVVLHRADPAAPAR